MRRRVLLVGFVVLPFATGCLSSSESISKSISSPFEWSSASSASSSRSSSPGGESYRDDVRDYTAAYVQSGGDYTEFSRGLSNVAAKHGVSDWESDDNTYEGIGAGLRKANQTPTQLSAWQQNLAGGDTHKAAAMQHGYDSFKPR
jgi:hypothetical protein